MKRWFLRILLVTLMLVLALSFTAFAKKGGPPYTVGLSNGPFTHSWRVQMIESLHQEFEFYKKQGLVDRLIIQNAGPDVGTQIAQIRNLIASGVDLLLINPNSSTALNPVIEEAQEAGILVVVYDMPIDNPKVLDIYMNQDWWMTPLAEWFCKQLNYKGNIVYISGIADQPGNIQRDQAAEKVLAKYPNIKLLAKANGNWDQAAAQQVMSDLLASFPKIDGVLTQDGMTLGIIRAFEAAGRKVPVVTGETQVAFIKKWKEMKDKQGFSTFGIVNPPGYVNIALGVGLRLLQGKKLKPEVLVNGHVIYTRPNLIVDNKNIDQIYKQYKDWADSYYVNSWYSQKELDELFQ
ncbi:MAG: substrate-binding domain-containing protein [Firmicutes bacterium]|nr:substrate-binding domain-containing protein [Bacillota bacterium]